MLAGGRKLEPKQYFIPILKVIQENQNVALIFLGPSCSGTFRTLLLLYWRLLLGVQGWFSKGLNLLITFRTVYDGCRCAMIWRNWLVKSIDRDWISGSKIWESYAAELAVIEGTKLTQSCWYTVWALQFIYVFALYIRNRLAALYWASFYIWIMLIRMPFRRRPWGGCINYNTIHKLQQRW